MCLAIPARITKLLDDNMAIADLGGVSRTISLALVENIAVDDYVIVHVGYALSRMDPKEAEKTLQLFAEMNEAGAREIAANAGAGA